MMMMQDGKKKADRGSVCVIHIVRYQKKCKHKHLGQDYSHVSKGLFYFGWNADSSSWNVDN